MDIIEIIGSIGVILMLISTLTFMVSNFIKRQYWLSVNLDSVPDSLKKSYLTPYHFPFWMLNKKGRRLILFSYSAIILGFVLSSVSAVILNVLF
jgi:hypothetical protein